MDKLSEDMKGTCLRCGKPFSSLDDIHTCTPPRALALAEQQEGGVCARCGGLVFDPVIPQKQQEPVAWGMMNDDGAIYDCITPEEHARCEGEYTVPLYAAQQDDTALLRQAMECLERSDCLGYQANLPVIAAIKERLK